MKHFQKPWVLVLIGVLYFSGLGLLMNWMSHGAKNDIKLQKEKENKERLEELHKMKIVEKEEKVNMKTGEVMEKE